MSVWADSRFRQWAQSANDGSAFLAWWQRGAGAARIFENAFGYRFVQRKIHFLLPLAVAVAVGLAVLFGPWILLPLGLIAAMSYLWPRAGLAALPAAYLWSPEFALAGVGNELAFLRIDHALVLGLLAHLCRRAAFRDTGLYVPLFLFLAASVTSALLGLLRGYVATPEYALMYCVQLLYLAAGFVCAYSLGHRLPRAVPYAWALAMVAFAAYGIAETRFPLEVAEGLRYRSYERGFFDRQANHAAYALVLGGLTGLGMLAHSRWRGLGLALVLLCLAGLWGTGSREGVAALAAGLAAMLLLRLPALLWAAPLVFVLLCMALPAGFWDALLRPDGSFFDRILHWKAALATVDQHPVLGLGLGARHRRFYDSQYIMLLAETGLAGLLFFSWWVAALARALWHGARAPGASVFAAAAFCALVALCVQSLACVGFVVTMMAGPCYWLAGVSLARQRELP